MRIITFVSASTVTPEARFALDLCLGARRLGHEVILGGLVRTRATPGLTELGAAADAERIPFRLLQQRYRFDPGMIGQMEMMFRRLKPDLYLSHDYLGAALARTARFRPRCHAHFEHDGDGTPDMERRWFGRRLLKSCDVIVVESDARAEALAKCGVKREKIMIASDSEDWIAKLALRAVTGMMNP